jgi:HD superfamily phosphohydrolase YqeK
VAALLARWADARAVLPVERDRWLRAAYLHDAVKDADRAWLASVAPNAWEVDALRHGPAAAILARREGERDQGVLDAVWYHSVGFAGWDEVGRMLYLADYLEPGREHSSHADRSLADRVPADPRGALLNVAGRRIAALVSRQKALLPETVEFWNRLCRES